MHQKATNGKQKCSYLATKAMKAGDGELDRDKNGIPCEKLCGKNGENMP